MLSLEFTLTDFFRVADLLSRERWLSVLLTFLEEPETLFALLLSPLAGQATHLGNLTPFEVDFLPKDGCLDLLCFPSDVALFVLD